MHDILLSDLLQIILAALLAGILDTVVGFGGGLLLLPVLIMVVGGTDAIVLAALIPIGWNAVRVPLLRSFVDWRAVGLFSLGLLPGTFLGAWGLDLVDPIALRHWIGIFLLFLGVYHITRLYVEIPYPRIRDVIGFPLVGLLAGTLTALLGAGNGPLQSWTMTAAGILPRGVISVNGVLGVITGVFRMVAYGTEDLLGNLPWVLGIAGLLGAVLGAILGIRLSRRAADSTLRLLVGIAILLAGLKLTL